MVIYNITLYGLVSRYRTLNAFYQIERMYRPQLLDW